MGIKGENMKIIFSLVFLLTIGFSVEGFIIIETNTGNSETLSGAHLFAGFATNTSTMTNNIINVYVDFKDISSWNVIPLSIGPEWRFVFDSFKFPDGDYIRTFIGVNSTFISNEYQVNFKIKNK